VSGSSYTFTGGGWGHQLGMSQFGAYAMANRGFTYEEIVKFYLPGVQVQQY
jgi:stage II sporulation protein D